MRTPRRRVVLWPQPLPLIWQYRLLSARDPPQPLVPPQTTQNNLKLRKTTSRTWRLRKFNSMLLSPSQRSTTHSASTRRVGRNLTDLIAATPNVAKLQSFYLAQIGRVSAQTEPQGAANPHATPQPPNPHHFTAGEEAHDGEPSREPRLDDAQFRKATNIRGRVHEPE